MRMIHRRHDMLLRPHERLRGLPFNRMIPNILTLLALCAGITAVRFGLQERWEFAVLAIFLAAVLDGLDGRIARILKGASKFGAELDSLSDFVCFGVAPGLTLYLWSLHQIGGFGWVLALLFSVCCALRLARFNTALEEPERPTWMANYFSGVPSPAGAGLVLLPMLLHFQWGADVFRAPLVVGPTVVVVAALLVSPIPTFAFKKIRITPRWLMPTMLIVGLYAALLASAPWLTMAVSLFGYVLLIPLSVRSYRAMARAQRREAPAVAPAATAAAPGETVRPSVH